MDTPRLGLPAILAAQAQKHVTHNAALAILDALVQASVINRTTTGAPVSPTAGDSYIVASPATGVWAGQEDALATWDGTAWSFVPPARGVIAFDQSAGNLLVFNVTWGPLTVSGDFSGETVLADRLGVGGATPDATNKFAFYGTNLLLNSGGSIDLKYNKDAAGDDASMTFQQGFNTRALLGLLANNDFTLKVGAAFNTALVANQSDGDVVFPNQRSVRSIRAFGGRWYCYADNRWTGPSSFATENKATNLGTGATPNVDWDMKSDVFVKSGSVLNSVSFGWNFNNAEVTDVFWKMYFQYNAWDGNADTAGETTRVELTGGTFTPSGAGIAMNLADIDLGGYVTPADGFFVMTCKPAGTLTATRYFQVSGQIDMLVQA